MTTSARTSGAAIADLVSTIDAPFYLFEWTQKSDSNPYLGFLGLADSIVVTADSTSMLAKACATRKPVHIFDLASDRQDLKRPSWWRRCNRDRALLFLYRNVLLRIALNIIKRDIGRVHETLIDADRAVGLGKRFPEKLPPPLEEMPRILHRVRHLISDAAVLPPDLKR